MRTIEKKKRDNSCHNPGNPIPVQGTQEIASQRVQFYKFPRGGMPSDPPRSSCLWHSAARTVNVHRLNHCIWYFQMLPKTLPKYTVEKSNLLLMLSGDLDCPWGRLKNPHTIQGEELGKRPRLLSCLIFFTLVAADGSNTCRLTLNFLYNQNLILFMIVLVFVVVKVIWKLFSHVISKLSK